MENSKIDISLKGSTKRLLDYYSNEEITFEKSLDVFILLIKLGEYQEASNILNKIYVLNTDIYNKQDFNYYIYMLSFVTELPLFLQSLTKALQFNDIRILDDDKRYKDIPSYNGVRRKIFKRRFCDAYNEFAEISKRNNDKDKHDIEYRLINTCINENLKNCLLLNNLINEERY